MDDTSPLGRRATGRSGRSGAWGAETSASGDRGPPAPYGSGVCTAATPVSSLVRTAFRVSRRLGRRRRATTRRKPGGKSMVLGQAFRRIVGTWGELLFGRPSRCSPTLHSLNTLAPSIVSWSRVALGAPEPAGALLPGACVQGNLETGQDSLQTGQRGLKEPMHLSLSHPKILVDQAVPQLGQGLTLASETW